MNEEDLKKKLLEQQKLKQQQKILEKQLETLLWKLLSPQAKQRLNNVKLVNKQLYLLAAQNIIGFYQSNQLNEKISDQQLKELLKVLANATKKEIKIKRK